MGTNLALILLSLVGTLCKAGASRAPIAQITSVVFSPSHELVAAGYEDGTIRLWELSSGRERARLTGHSERTTSLDFSSTGAMFASGAGDGEVKLWRLAEGGGCGLIRSFQSTAPVQSLHFDCHGLTLAVSDMGDRIELWDLRNCRCSFSAEAHFAGFSQDGRRLATCDWKSGQFQTSVWSSEGDVATANERSEFVWFPPALPSGKWRVRAGGGWSGSRVYISSLVDPSDIRFLGFQEQGNKFSRILCWAVTSDGQMIATGGFDGTVAIWDIDSALRSLKGPPTTKHGKVAALLKTAVGRVTAVGFSYDGTLLAVGGSGDLEVWNVASKKRIRLLPGEPPVQWTGFAVSLGIWLLFSVALCVRRRVQTERDCAGSANITNVGSLPKVHSRLTLLVRRITFAVSVTVVALLLAAFLGKFWKASKQFAAVSALAKRGAKVWYDYQSTSGGNSAFVQPSEPNLLLLWFSRDFFHTVVEVDCSENRVAGDSEWTGYVEDTDLASLEHLAGLRKLELPDLPISDAGLSHMVNLHHLARLNLAGTDITDSGLKYMEGLTGLKYLDVRHTRVTATAIGQLRQFLPHCTIKFHTEENTTWDQPCGVK